MPGSLRPYDSGANGRQHRWPDGKEDPVSVHTPLQNDSTKDPYAFYASPVGPRILEQANKIFEDFPVTTYALYFAVFMIEVAAVFFIGIKLVQ
jgi:hypothetical protein